MKAFQKVLQILFGYDFFISYAHQDGLDYAEKLEEELKSRDFKVFRDSSELHGGESLSLSIRNALTKTRRLIVIGTRSALTKHWVQQEVRLFKYNNKDIVPIDVHEIRAEQIWFDANDYLFLDEPLGALGPSEGVVDRISRGMYKHRLARKVRRIVYASIFVLIVLLIASVGFGYSFLKQRNLAVTEALRAKAGQVSKLIELGKRSVPAHVDGWKSLGEAIALSEQIGGNSLPVAINSYVLQQGIRDFRAGGLGREPGIQFPLSEVSIDAVPRAIAWEGNNTVVVQSKDGDLWHWKLGEIPIVIYESGVPYGSNLGHIEVNQHAINFLDSEGLQRIDKNGNKEPLLEGKVSAFSGNAAIVNGKLFYRDSIIDTDIIPLRISTLGDTWAIANQNGDVVVNDVIGNNQWGDKHFDLGSPVLAIDLHPIAVAFAGGAGRLRVSTIHNQDSVLVGHSGPVSNVEFGEEYLLSSGSDGTARIWEWELEEEKLRMVGPQVQINASSLSPDGTLMAAAFKNGELKMWLTQSGLKHELKGSLNLDQWAVIKDKIIGWKNRELLIWDSGTSAVLYNNELSEAVLSVSNSKGQIQVCDVKGISYQIELPSGIMREMAGACESSNSNRYLIEFEGDLVKTTSNTWIMHQEGEAITIKHSIGGEVSKLRIPYVGKLYQIPGSMNLVEEGNTLSLWLLEEASKWLKDYKENNHLIDRLVYAGSCNHELVSHHKLQKIFCD